MSGGGGGGGDSDTFFFQSAINVNWVGRGTCVPSVDLRGDKQQKKKKKKKKKKGFSALNNGGAAPPHIFDWGGRSPPQPPRFLRPWYKPFICLDVLSTNSSSYQKMINFDVVDFREYCSKEVSFVSHRDGKIVFF